ncbi:MAG: DUF6538 domain-containing protein [Devosia sp.]
MLTKRGIYYYQRKVPLGLREADTRSPIVRISLKTKSIAEARVRRDAYEQADKQLWGAMTAGDDQQRAIRAYRAAVKRAEALGFSYRSSFDLAEGPIDELLQRAEALDVGGMSAERASALLGGEEPPQLAMTDVGKLYIEQIATDELRTKSDQQRRKWRTVKLRAVTSFVGVLGNDKPIDRVSRDDALKYWRFWQVRVAPNVGRPSHTPSSANKDLGALRTIYASYFAHLGQTDRINPFAGLAFKEKAKKKKVRPPFPTEWIRDRILADATLLGRLGVEARAILLSTIETGARPSETCNLLPSMIRVNAEVPHLAFEEREDPDDPRELKSAASIRVVPLVGIALEIFKLFPSGFPHFREREELASASINKYMRNNGLMPTPKHTLYGLRHSLEDRMKEADLSDDLRRMLLGHRIDREEYGIGGSLKWRKSKLQKIALPYDAGLISGLRDDLAAREPKP